VAAIGGTGRMPYGRQSRRSNRTGPAVTGAPVASRSAVTASANSPGASGGATSLAANTDSSSSMDSRSGSSPNPGGSSPFASGQYADSSPTAAMRTAICRPSSMRTGVETPTSGAAAAYAWRSPSSERSSSMYARLKTPSSQSKPPQVSVTDASSG